MAEELDLHLLELARAEREVARRNLVAEALADLGDAEGNTHTATVHDVLEVGEDTLGGFGTQEGGAFLAAERTDEGLEHQVEFARLCQRAKRLGVRAEYLREIRDGGQANNGAVPLQILRLL